MGASWGMLMWMGMELRGLALRAGLAVALVLGAAGGTVAEERVTLGWGRLFTNDLIGDGKDRWRTGSYTVSRVRGPAWSGPEGGGLDGVGFGQIVEMRAHAAAISPASLTVPVAGDRRYAGVLSLGLASHFGWQGAQVALGAEMALTGPQTGVGSFQRRAHRLTGMLPPSAAVLAAQIGNRLHPGVNAEIGRDLALGGESRLRPYIEARAGLETLLRVGADVTFGQLGQDDLMLRDSGTGVRFRAVEGTRTEGISLTLGGDVARVFDTALLPAGGAAVASDSRYRVRAGVHWQGTRAAAFYGLTYLSPEFEAQPEGQLVGALSLNLRF